MIEFSIDIKKNSVFSIETKKKLSFCFTVKCIVVKSVKQYQGISKDGDLI